MREYACVAAPVLACGSGLPNSASAPSRPIENVGGPHRAQLRAGSRRARSSSPGSGLHSRWHFSAVRSLYNGSLRAWNSSRVDTAFGLRAALPIATTMACAALALAIVHLDWRTLQTLIWRRDERVSSASSSGRRRILWLAVLTLVIGFPLFMNLAARRGLGGQVPPAGRWEALECRSQRSRWSEKTGCIGAVAPPRTAYCCRSATEVNPGVRRSPHNAYRRS